MDTLSTHDFDLWADALRHQPDSPRHLLGWIDTHVRPFFPFREVFLGHGELLGGSVRLTHWQALGHDLRYVAELTSSFNLDQRRCVKWWVANRRPFVVDPAKPPPFLTRFELEEIHEWGLGSLAAHGVLNVKGRTGTYFLFSGVAMPVWERHLDQLRLLAPVLNDQFLAFIAEQEARPDGLKNLSSRQRDIVRRVAQGFDDKSIAQQLGLAEKTVRNQLTMVYQQLRIRKRSHLVELLR